MRQTMFVRNTSGIEAKLKARNARQRERVKAQTVRSLERVFTEAQANCPRDSHYMALHMDQGLTRGGYNFFVGFRREDFVGQINKLVQPERLITAFYPEIVIKGRRGRAGNDFLSAALKAERDNIRRGYARALSDRTT